MPRRTNNSPVTSSFVPKCSAFAFSAAEWADLVEYGASLSDLVDGRRTPATPDQMQFVKFFNGDQDREPANYWEALWSKYLFRITWESDPENRGAMGPLRQLPDSPVGSRADFKKLHAGDSDPMFFVRRRRS